MAFAVRAVTSEPDLIHTPPSFDLDELNQQMGKRQKSCHFPKTEIQEMQIDPRNFVHFSSELIYGNIIPIYRPSWQPIQQAWIDDVNGSAIAECKITGRMCPGHFAKTGIVPGALYPEVLAHLLATLILHNQPGSPGEVALLMMTSCACAPREAIKTGERFHIFLHWHREPQTRLCEHICYGLIRKANGKYAAVAYASGQAIDGKGKQIPLVRKNYA